MKRVVDKEQVESLLPTNCDGGFRLVAGEEKWCCDRCSAAGPWECQDIPAQTSRRLHHSRRENERGEG